MGDCTNWNCDCEVLRNRVQELEAQLETLMDIVHCTMNIMSPYCLNHQEDMESTSDTEAVMYS